MGFHISKVGDTQLGEYFGSNTIFNAAEEGAFDVVINKETEKLFSPSVMIIVERNGIDHCLEVLQNTLKPGRDTQKLIKEIQLNYKEGFMLHY